MDEQPSELNLHLRMAPEYALGLPMFVEVTLSNQTLGAEYYDLLPCDPWLPPFPVELTFFAGTNRVTLPAKSVTTRGARASGFDLGPGQARTFVLDISELDPEVGPGAWECQARWIMRHEKPQSSAVPVALVPAVPTDIPLLERLRVTGGAHYPSWANLVKARETPDDVQALQGLSERAGRALVPYLILRQAIHGPEPLAVFPLDFLAPHLEGPWAGEASILSYELAWARQEQDLPNRKRDLLRRWPGLAFRVEQIEVGAGMLTSLRVQYGAGERHP